MLIMQHFPRVYLSNGDDSHSSCDKPNELVVIKEAWSPIAVGLDVSSNDKHAIGEKSKGNIGAADFHLLLEDLTEVIAESESSQTKLELLATMLLLQYLINVLEGDFLPRNHAFLENFNWTSVKESLLNKLLGSRKINYKVFVKDCIFILCNPFSARAQMNDDAAGTAENSLSTTHSESDEALAFCLPEVEKSTCSAVQKLLVMMMELDSSRKTAEKQNLTTRSDGLRTPAVELILDALSYDKDLISPFLQGFDDPKWKLEIVTEYLQKYTPKPSTRNRNSNGLKDDAKTTVFLRCFENKTNTKGIVKKVGAGTVQLLLAHFFQACMSSPKEQLEEISDLNKDDGNKPLVNISKIVISAFTMLRETDKELQILPISKEALFAAGAFFPSNS